MKLKENARPAPGESDHIVTDLQHDSNTKQQFSDFLLSHSIKISANKIIDDGRLHRCDTTGKNGKTDAAYILHMDGIPAGFYENFQTAERGNWRADIGREITPDEQAALQKKIREMQRQRDEQLKQGREDAADKARYIWLKSKKADEHHPYLTKKSIKPHHARLYRDALVIPIISKDKKIRNLQFIDPEGNKRFLSGGKKKGCFSPIGAPSGKILIAEGYATAASLHESTKQCAIAAMDSGNLIHVAQEMRRLFSDVEIIICGDNDASGVGQDAAKKAALAVGGKVLIPETIGADWNDVISGGGAV